MTTLKSNGVTFEIFKRESRDYTNRLWIIYFARPVGSKGDFYGTGKSPCTAVNHYNRLVQFQ